MLAVSRLIVFISALISAVSVSSAVQASSSATIVMKSDKLKNSVAGRIVQRRFEQYIGERYSFVTRVARIGPIETEINLTYKPISNYVYTGSLEKIIIPDGYNRLDQVTVVFSGVKAHNREAEDAIHSLPSQVLLAQVADIAGTKFPLLGEHVGINRGSIIKSLLANQVNPELWKAVGANGRVIAKYCQGKDEYCEVLIEEVQAWNESEQEQQTFKLLAPTVIMLKRSEFSPVAYAGG